MLAVFGADDGEGQGLQAPFPRPDLNVFAWHAKVTTCMNIITLLWSVMDTYPLPFCMCILIRQVY